jgi:hypothetical protein
MDDGPLSPPGINAIEPNPETSNGSSCASVAMVKVHLYIRPFGGLITRSNDNVTTRSCNDGYMKGPIHSMWSHCSVHVRPAG